ncbi:aquaporin-like protein [Protomyces lactucae-debilis]|uniref:Aquaporin-like protein n=1 Tax=Protomyces lactucae-debilis TaxID=2754530 RepID=A0A1Y2FWJ2_PROLT|nr:aquaporin-like protein [Protomyces lactucae-debilis]ORY87025.1 aquaporin-like protein [Protomyces lactucae-debilis]
MEHTALADLESAGLHKPNGDLRARNPRMAVPQHQYESWAPKFRAIQSQGPSKEDKEKNKSEDLTFVSKARRYLREPLAEFVGTMILILFGDGSVAQVTLSNNEFGSYQSISWCWGIGVMLGVYHAGGISGGLLNAVLCLTLVNPAVTLANCLFRRFPWKKLIPYSIAQILGAMVGAAIVYANYQSAIDQFEGGVGVRTTKTSGIFATYALDALTPVGQFFSEVVATAILIMTLFAIGDEQNNPAGDFGPLIIFFLIFGLGAAFGYETGYALNLARDFGPRLVSYMLGYGKVVWTANGNYSIIPCTAPFVGAIIGGLVYDTLIFTGDSPLNRRHFGIDEWRWRHGVNTIVEDVVDALPDAMVPGNRDDSSSSSTAEGSRERQSTLQGSKDKHSEKRVDFAGGHLDTHEQLADASQQNMPIGGPPHLDATGRTHSI